MNSRVIKTGLASFGMSGRVFHAPFIEQNPAYELTVILERTQNITLDDFNDYHDTIPIVDYGNTMPEYYDPDDSYGINDSKEIEVLETSNEKVNIELGECVSEQEHKDQGESDVVEIAPKEKNLSETENVSSTKIMEIDLEI